MCRARKSPKKSKYVFYNVPFKNNVLLFLTLKPSIMFTSISFFSDLRLLKFSFPTIVAKYILQKKQVLKGRLLTAKHYQQLGECSICQGQGTNPNVFLKCGHGFCKGCMDRDSRINKVCPLCRVPYGEVQSGNQPVGGDMECSFDRESLPGYGKCGTIIVKYNIPDGLQGTTSSLLL